MAPRGILELNPRVEVSQNLNCWLNLFAYVSVLTYLAVEEELHKSDQQL
jgi:hypothetical protein